MSSGAVTLREVTRETLEAILKLKVAPSQESFVAPNAVSIAQAHFHPETAWFRGVHAGDDPVGFVMLDIDTTKPEYGVWRFMIDERHQGKGYGRQAMQLVIAHVRTLPGATELLLGVVPGEGGPGPFYQALGFAFTGEVHHGEQVMRLAL